MPKSRIYVHFDKSYWSEIKLAERFDPIGNKVFNKYKEIYQKQTFDVDQDEKMARYQEERKVKLSVTALNN